MKIYWCGTRAIVTGGLLDSNCNKNIMRAYSMYRNTNDVADEIKRGLTVVDMHFTRLHALKSLNSK